MDKICANCKYFMPNKGNFGLGACVSITSKKKGKYSLLKIDTCQKWEGKNEVIQR